MSTKMSQITRQEVLAAQRDRYAGAGKEHKTKIINELVELFGYHRKAAIRALQPRSVIAAPFVLGRPKAYDPDQLRPPLKAIWLAALQPCGVRLKACLPDWLAAYEEDHRRLNADVRQALLAASRATLDRLVPLINALCKGPLNQLLNYFLPTMKLESKERVGSKVVRKYGPTMTPWSRGLACPEVTAGTKQRLRAQKQTLNPFALTREVERQMKAIEQNRRRKEA